MCSIRTQVWVDIKSINVGWQVLQTLQCRPCCLVLRDGRPLLSSLRHQPVHQEGAVDLLGQVHAPGILGALEPLNI